MEMKIYTLTFCVSVQRNQCTVICNVNERFSIRFKMKIIGNENVKIFISSPISTESDTVSQMLISSNFNC